MIILDNIDRLEIKMVFFQILGLILLLQSIHLLKSDYIIRGNEPRFSWSVFNLSFCLPKIYHNLTIISLIPLGLLQFLFYDILSGSVLMISAGILFYLNIYCFSYWHHDIFLNGCINLLAALWAFFPNLIIYKESYNVFAILIVFQILFLYFFSFLTKCNRFLIRSPDLMATIQNRKYIRFYLRKLILYHPMIFVPLNISAIFIELYLAIGLFLPFSYSIEIFVVIGVLFHMILYYLNHLGRSFHALIPATYLVFLSLFLPSNVLHNSWLIVLVQVPILFSFLLIGSELTIWRIMDRYP